MDGVRDVLLTTGSSVVVRVPSVTSTSGSYDLDLTSGSLDLDLARMISMMRPLALCWNRSRTLFV